jgi:hypothetical protein
LNESYFPYLFVAALLSFVFKSWSHRKIERLVVRMIPASGMDLLGNWLHLSWLKSMTFYYQYFCDFPSPAAEAIQSSQLSAVFVLSHSRRTAAYQSRLVKFRALSTSIISINALIVRVGSVPSILIDQWASSPSLT